MTTARDFLPSTARDQRFQLAKLLPSLRRQLETQRVFRAEQLAELGNGTDTAGSAERQQVDAAIADAARWALAAAEAALARMDAGEYGTCEHCAEPIPLERLEVLPHTRFCPCCQEQQASTAAEPH